MDNVTLHKAIELVKAGNRLEGRKLLEDLVNREPNNEIAWLWLCACFSKNKNKITCLENVLRINPDNEKAKLALEKLIAMEEEPSLEAIVAEKQKEPVVHSVQQKKAASGGLSLKNPIILWGLIAGTTVFILIFAGLMWALIRSRDGKVAGISIVQAVQMSLTPTNTQIPSTTPTNLPTKTKTPAPTRTKRPTSTPSPTRTPAPTHPPVRGSFTNPLLVGESVTLVDIPQHILKPGAKNTEMSFTLQDVKRGEEARALAQQNMGYFGYQDPIDGQEYLAIRGNLRIIRDGDNTRVEPIYPYFSLTLRYSKDGIDTWSADPTSKFNEGYPPIEGEGWVFFLIRKDSNPYLYFQPNLIVSEQLGIRSIGAYFRLFE